MGGAAQSILHVFMRVYAQLHDPGQIYHGLHPETKPNGCLVEKRQGSTPFNPRDALSPDGKACIADFLKPLPVDLANLFREAQTVLEKTPRDETGNLSIKALQGAGASPPVIRAAIVLTDVGKTCVDEGKAADVDDLPALDTVPTCPAAEAMEVKAPTADIVPPKTTWWDTVRDRVVGYWRLFVQETGSPWRAAGAGGIFLGLLYALYSVGRLRGLSLGLYRGVTFRREPYWAVTEGLRVYFHESMVSGLSTRLTRQQELLTELKDMPRAGRKGKDIESGITILEQSMGLTRSSRAEHQKRISRLLPEEITPRRLLPQREAVAIDPQWAKSELLKPYIYKRGKGEEVWVSIAEVRARVEKLDGIVTARRINADKLSESMRRHTEAGRTDEAAQCEKDNNLIFDEIERLEQEREPLSVWLSRLTDLYEMNQDVSFDPRNVILNFREGMENLAFGRDYENGLQLKWQADWDIRAMARHQATFEMSDGELYLSGNPNGHPAAPKTMKGDQIISRSQREKLIVGDEITLGMRVYSYQKRGSIPYLEFIKDLPLTAAPTDEEIVMGIIDQWNFRYEEPVEGVSIHWTEKYEDALSALVGVVRNHLEFLGNNDLPASLFAGLSDRVRSQRVMMASIYEMDRLTAPSKPKTDRVVTTAADVIPITRAAMAIVDANLMAVLHDERKYDDKVSDLYSLEAEYGTLQGIWKRLKVEAATAPQEVAV